MNTRKGFAFWAIALVLILGVSTLALAQTPRNANRQQQQQQQVQPQQQGVGPAPQSKDEFESFMAVQNEQMPAKKVELAEAFLTKYPNSDFVQYAHTLRVGAYAQLGKNKESVGAADQAIDSIVKFGEKLLAKADADAKLTDKDKEAIRKKDKNAAFLDKNSPQFQKFMNESEIRILMLCQSAMQSYQQLNDAPKILEWGEKALGFKPDDLNTLMTLSNVMAERPPQNEEEKQKAMKRAEEFANSALTALPGFLASPEASRLPADAKSDITAQLHYTIGLIYLHQKKLGPSETEFLTALKSRSNDPITYYRLGVAYVQDMKNDQAMEALGKSAFLKGVSEAGARDILKQLYVNKNKSDQGMEDYIKSMGAKIGQ